MTRIGTHSTQPREPFSDTVDRGWRVARLPSRVGMYARVPREGAELGDVAPTTNNAQTNVAADAEGSASR
jgi:hypothetical protein